MPVAAPVPERRWRNVTVTRERDPRRSRWLALLFLGIVAALVPVAVYLIQQMEYVQVRYRIEEQRSRRETLEETERRLRIERAALESLPSVEASATSKLGLVHPLPGQVVVAKSTAPGRGAAATRAPDSAPKAK